MPRVILSHKHHTHTWVQFAMVTELEEDEAYGKRMDMDTFM
jgi:hypothetical protein